MFFNVYHHTNLSCICLFLSSLPSPLISTVSNHCPSIYQPCYFMLCSSPTLLQTHNAYRSYLTFVSPQRTPTRSRLPWSIGTCILAVLPIAGIRLCLLLVLYLKWLNLPYPISTLTIHSRLCHPILLSYCPVSLPQPATVCLGGLPPVVLVFSPFFACISLFPRLILSSPPRT
jgi:hypothetical protein